MGAAPLFELPTPFTEAELWDISYEQEADVMVLGHLQHPVQRLNRYAHDRWTLTDAVIGTSAVAGPDAHLTAFQPVVTGAHNKTWGYLITGVDPSTGEEGLTGASDTAVNDLSLAGNYNLIMFTPTPGYITFNIYKGDVAILGFIGQATNGGQFRDENYLPDYSQSFPIPTNPFGGPGNYPGAVTFFEQRMFMARTLNRPNAFFGSQSGNFFNFNVSRPIQADDAVTFGLLARRVNAILHLVPLKDMLAFTSDAIFSISGGNGSGISPSAIDISPQGYRGASRVRPVVIGDVVFFNTARGATIRTLNYQFESSGYKGNNIGVFAPHLFKGFNVVDMAWCETPTNTLWVTRSDGRLLALTWMEEQDVWGWSVCDTKGIVESCCSVGETDEDILYVVVRRFINGVWTRYVERLAPAEWSTVEEAVYVDCARSYSGEPVSNVSGLNYLEGATVSVLADGSALLNQTVTGGKLSRDLPTPASQITVGLPYEPWIRTLPFVPQVGGGSLKFQKQAVGETPVIAVLKTRGIEVALSAPPALGSPDPTQASDEAGEFYSPRTRTEESLSQTPALYSGPLFAEPGMGDWTEETTGLVIRQRYPLPMNIVGLVPGIEKGG